MALIIEDGSIVANADSYVTAAEITAYADKRGFVVPTLTADLEKLAILAIDYMQSKDYIGDLVEADQPLTFPRKNINGVEINEIPTDIKNAQIELAIAAYSDDLLTTGPSAQVTKESTGSTSTEYAGSGLSALFGSQRVAMYLRKYLSYTKVIRV